PRGLQLPHQFLARNLQFVGRAVLKAKREPSERGLIYDSPRFCFVIIDGTNYAFLDQCLVVAKYVIDDLILVCLDKQDRFAPGMVAIQGLRVSCAARLVRSSSAL